jgi:hypothetical protein
MKPILMLFLSLVFFSTTKAQLKAKPKCGTFEVDILDGKVNGMKPNTTANEIKAALPCFTSAEDESPTAKCGGGVFYKDRDISFYTDRDYVEIGEKFKGTFNVPVMGAKRNTLFKYLGNPKIKDDSWDAFEMSYGTLVLHYNVAGKVKTIQFSTRSTDTLNLCE